MNFSKLKTVPIFYASSQQTVVAQIFEIARSNNGKKFVIVFFKSSRQISIQTYLENRMIEIMELGYTNLIYMKNAIHNYVDIFLLDKTLHILAGEL